MTFEHRHENKSCSACPKDQFASLASLQVCEFASFASLLNFQIFKFFMVPSFCLTFRHFLVPMGSVCKIFCDSDTDMTREDVKSAKIANCYRHAGFFKDFVIESDFDVLHDIQLLPNMHDVT